MDDDRDKLQIEIKLLREMQLELRPKSTKEMLSKEEGEAELKAYEEIKKRTNGSCSKDVTIENEIKNNTVSEDYLKKIGDLKEDSISLDLIHETSELSVYIDRRYLDELIFGVKWISTSILSLWCSYLHGICISKNVSELFGFLDPNRTLITTREFSAIKSYIQDKLDDESQKCYLGPLLNDCMLFVPKIMITFGYQLLRGVENKKSNWKIVKIFTDTSPYEKEIIDHIRQLWAQVFLQMVENQKVEEQNLQNQMQMVEEDKDIEILPKQKSKKKKKIYI
ncbi:uncharacterized protein LOC131642114 [Vicia villosa]|uniref:uncharacterized protein LOC131642114 n=1 Tax=Vicia villosa TaxID=3911 RepID=UPI00273B7953|nr:uncharacterized protein LOC131642114 [Vicia villosa]